MKKSRQVALKNAIEQKVDIEENNKCLTIELIKSPIVRLGILLFIFVISIIFKNQIAKLCNMTSEAIFGNGDVLGVITYFFLIIVFMIIFASVSIFFLIHRKNEDLSSYVNLKNKNLIYTIYDNVGFIFTAFITLLFIVMVLFTPCNISGNSMNYTFNNNDRVIIWSLGYEATKDDVIVFDAEDYSFGNENAFYIKRVLGVENDVLSYNIISSSEGELLVNGEVIGNIKLNQYYIITGRQDVSDYTIPVDKVLVLGDNRCDSYDSRSFGLINEEDVIGKVLFRFFPFNEFGNPHINIKQ